jgi:hypothetical protein
VETTSAPGLVRPLEVKYFKIARRPRRVYRLARQLYYRAVTLAAIWSAILTAVSARLALHVLISIMTLFLCASVRPQPQPGAAPFC